MFLFYFSISLAIASSALYHFVAKSTPSNVNFTVSLLVTYAIAFAVTLLGFFFFPVRGGIMTEVKQLNWASVGLAIAIVGIEFGFLLTYRAGWNLGIAAVLVNGDTEATLKRVKRQGNMLILMPDNPEYEPIVITPDNPARIIGRAVQVTQVL